MTKSKFNNLLLIDIGYMARHNEDLEKAFTDWQKEIFEKNHDCGNEHASLAEASRFFWCSE